MWGDCGLVFTTRIGDPFDPRNFHTAFKTRSQRSGVPVLPVHARRRTCARLLVSLDVHLSVAIAVLRPGRIHDHGGLLPGLVPGHALDAEELDGQLGDDAAR